MVRAIPGAVRRTALAAAGAAALILAAPLPAASGEPPKPAPAGTLEALVRQLVELQVEAAEEENRWAEGKEHLEATLSLLEREKKELDRKLSSAREEGDAAGKERQRLAAEIDAAGKLLDATDAVARRRGADLLAEFARLPEPLRKPHAKGAARLKDALELGSKGLSVPDRLRLAAAFAADLDRTLSKVHAVKQVLDLGEGGRREVDVLYVGGAVGYYVSPDGGYAGLLLRDGDDWKPAARNELAPEVRRALAVLNKEEPAALVELPVPAAPRGGDR